MRLRDIRPVHVFSLLSFFTIVWVVSEVREHLQRQAFAKTVESFMSASGPDAGNRFTSDDGMALERRLEAQIYQLQGRQNAHLQHSAKYTQLIIDLEKDVQRLEAELAALRQTGTF